MILSLPPLIQVSVATGYPAILNLIEIERQNHDSKKEASGRR